MSAPATTMTLTNRDGYSVEVPEELAKKYFKALYAADAVADVAMAGAPTEATLPGAEDADDEPLVMDLLAAPKEVLDVIQTYVGMNKRAGSIPKPLTKSFSDCVSREELQIVKDAEAGGYIRELLEQAIMLRFEDLIALCAAYMFTHFDEIAKEAPDIMAGAERIREYLKMENEWTEEEMGHLRKEAEYAKKANPDVY